METYRPTSDWIFYFLCGVFALLTSLLPILGGRYWMMLGMQGTGLWIFTALAARYGPAGRHVSVFLWWTGTQVGFLLLLGSWNMAVLERILPHGFELRRLWLELYHAEAAFGWSLIPDPSPLVQWLEPYYAGAAAGPPAAARWIPLAGRVLLATAGSLVTGGLPGSGLTAHGANYVAYFLTGLIHIVGGSDASGWVRFANAAVPWGQVVLLAGLGTTHLGLSPWLWRRRLDPAVAWPLQKPMLGLGLAATAVGVVAVLF